MDVKDVRKTTTEATVTFLKKPEVSFVSLVKHGANNTPFRVIKSNTAEGDGMNKIVQSIRVRKGSKADLRKVIGKGFKDGEVKTDGDYLVYKQVDEAICDLNTKSVVVIDPEEHIYAVTYGLLENAEDKKTADPIVLKTDLKEVSYWDVMDEMYAMTDLIYGAMGQSVMSPEDRKNLVLKSIDNFKAFCDIVLTEIKSAAPLPVGKEVGERTATKLLEVLQKQISTKSEGGETMFELKDKDELIGIVTKAVDTAITVRTQADAKSAEVLAAQEADKIAKEASAKEMTELKATVETLTKTIEKLSGTVVSTPNIGDENTNRKSGEKDNVYSGLFAKRNLASTPSISDAASA